MQLTTKRFQEVINQPSRKFSWSGKLYLRDGETIDFTDKEILKGTGYIQRSCSGSSELELGSVYASEFGLSLFTNVDRYRLEGAQISLRYHLHFDDGTQESIPMGIFEVSEANRSKKRLELKGYDFMLRFDRRFSVKETFGTAFELLTFICERCRVQLGMTEAQVLVLPNGIEMLSIYPENDIETYRDLLHYLASTLGSVALIDRYGRLVLRQFGTTPVTQIEAKHRFDSSVSDFKTYYTAINSTNMKTKWAEYYALEQDTGLTMNLGVNPLMQLGLSEKRERMCQRLLEAVSQISYTPFDATTIGNPSLDPADMIEHLYEGEVVRCLITSIEYKINGKHRISGVGKNPYYSQSKSKHDKNLVGILNRIESEHMIVHSYSNSKAFDLTTEEMPVIRIDFASDKETEALFNASILLDVTTTAVEEKKQVSLSPVTTGSDPPIESVVYEMVEEKEVPTNVIVTYILNHERIDYHVPIETYSNGQHVLNLFYPLSNLQEKTMNSFSVMMRLDSGNVRIEKDYAIAAISGQSLGTTEVWDGKLEVTEWWNKVSLSQGMLYQRKLFEDYQIGLHQPQSNVFDESVNRYVPNSLALKGWQEVVSVEVENV